MLALSPTYTVTTLYSRSHYTTQTVKRAVYVCPPFINASLADGNRVGVLGQIELQVFKRTSTDASLMDLWRERGGEILRVKKASNRDRAAELVSILHIMALVRAVKYPHSWN